MSSEKRNIFATPFEDIDQLPYETKPAPYVEDVISALNTAGLAGGSVSSPKQGQQGGGASASVSKQASSVKRTTQLYRNLLLESPLFTKIYAHCWWICTLAVFRGADPGPTARTRAGLIELWRAYLLHCHDDRHADSAAASASIKQLLEIVPVLLGQLVWRVTADLFLPASVLQHSV